MDTLPPEMSDYADNWTPEERERYRQIFAAYDATYVAAVAHYQRQRNILKSNALDSPQRD